MKLDLRAESHGIMFSILWYFCRLRVLVETQRVIGYWMRHLGMCMWGLSTNQSPRFQGLGRAFWGSGGATKVTRVQDK
jgi:hypothetical protein